MIKSSNPSAVPVGHQVLYLQNQRNNEAETDNGDITNEDELDFMTYIRQLEISLVTYNMRIETIQ
jgi:hypothetical protein